MRYLHGDSTPFSLNENFLDTLVHATDAAVGLLQAQVAREAAVVATQQADAAAQKELARIDQLARAVAHAVQENGDAEPNSATEAVAIRIVELCRGAIEDARSGVAAWRGETVQCAEAAVPDVQAVLERFLSKHQLPDTAWSLEWLAGFGGALARAQAHATTSCGLATTFEVRLPAEHLWSQPIRIAPLDRTAVIPIVRRGWLSGPKLKDEQIDRMFITRVLHQPNHVSMVLSTSAREPSEGLEVVLQDESGSPTPRVTPLEADGGAGGDTRELPPDAIHAMHRVWEQVESTISDLLWYRAELRVATLHGVQVRDVPQPFEVARTIVDVVAPYVREIREHSRSDVELSLKRDLGDGRREELFVSVNEVLGRLQGLRPDHAALFHAFGLSGR